MLPGVTVVPGSPGTVAGNDVPVPGGSVGVVVAGLTTVVTAASAGDSVPADGDWPIP